MGSHGELWQDSAIYRHLYEAAQYTCEGAEHED